MKYRSKVIIGSLAAVATFASLSALSWRHHRGHRGMHRHCMEDCRKGPEKEVRPAQTAPLQSPDTAR